MFDRNSETELSIRVWFLYYIDWTAKPLSRLFPAIETSVPESFFHSWSQPLLFLNCRGISTTRALLLLDLDETGFQSLDLKAGI